MISVVEFHSGDNVLRGELHVPVRERAPGILVCHAMHSEGFRWLPLYRLFAERACQRGFACLLFDFRGCGQSEGQFDYGWGEQEDARAAFDFLLQRREVDATGGFVVGRSLGGTIALYGLAHDPRVKGFALWATPPDHQENIRNFILKRYGRIGYLTVNALSYLDRTTRPLKPMRIELFGLKMRLRDLRRRMMALHGARLLAGTVHPPVLLIIGDRDEYVSISEIQYFAKIIDGRSRVEIIPNTGHTFKGTEAWTTEVTLEWFETFLK